MKPVRFIFNSFLLAAFFASISFAQAQRTFVSGLGSDGNPCSRTAPCRTFTQALSQANAGGEVYALDSAGYGPFTIGKSISIVAPPGVSAGISVFSGNGIVVNAGASDVVVLRGLTINSQGGFAGIHYSSGAALHVESCTINGFSGRGLNSAGPALFVKDTIIRNSNFGILTSSPSLSADGVRLEGNQFGFFATTGAAAAFNSIHNSVASGNAQQGITAFANGPSTFVEINIEACHIANNTSNGVVSTGSGGGIAVVRISASSVTDNGVGLLQVGTSSLLSRGNNSVEGNVTDLSGTIGSYTAK